MDARVLALISKAFGTPARPYGSYLRSFERLLRCDATQRMQWCPPRTQHMVLPILKLIHRWTDVTWFFQNSRVPLFYLGCAIALFFVHYCSVEESFTYC